MWEPSTELRALGDALQGQIPNVQGSVIARDGDATQLPVGAGVEALARVLARQPGVRSAGRERRPAKPSTAGRRRDVHEEGRAIDVMLSSPSSAEGRRVGAQLAAQLVTHARELGVQLVIYDGLEWSASTSGPAWEVYDGRDPHVSHVHVEITPARAVDGPGMAAAAAAVWPTGGGAGVLVALAALALALARGRRR